MTAQFQCKLSTFWCYSDQLSNCKTRPLDYLHTDCEKCAKEPVFKKHTYPYIFLLLNKHRASTLQYTYNTPLLNKITDYYYLLLKHLFSPSLRHCFEIEIFAKISSKPCEYERTQMHTI